MKAPRRRLSQFEKHQILASDASEDMVKTSELDRWFKEKWVDISKKKDGKHPPCGRSDADKGKYPKCRPSKRVTKQTPRTSKELSSSQKASAVRAKRKVEKKPSKPAGGKARKPKIAPALKRRASDSRISQLVKIARFSSINYFYKIAVSQDTENISDKKFGAHPLELAVALGLLNPEALDVLRGHGIGEGELVELLEKLQEADSPDSSHLLR